MKENNIWREAYKNTDSIQKSFFSYVKCCKSCKSIKYKKSTREMQLIGNQFQRVVICFCKKYFIVTN